MLHELSKETVYCPVCSTGRERPRLKIPTSRVVGLSLIWGLLFGLFLGILAGFWLGAVLGIVSVVLSFLGLEVYYSLKFKRELECPVCHFDPLLFKKSPDAAREKCQEGLRRKEPAFIARWRALKRDQLHEGS